MDDLFLMYAAHMQELDDAVEGELSAHLITRRRLFGDWFGDRFRRLGFTGRLRSDLGSCLLFLLYLVACHPEERHGQQDECSFHDAIMD